MITFKKLLSIIGILPKKKRIGLLFVTYNEADSLIKEGWTIARLEEDTNDTPQMVYLEKLEDIVYE